MYGSAISRVMSKDLGPQPSPEISHCGSAAVNCTQKQKKAWRLLDGELESSNFMRSSGSRLGFVCAESKSLKWLLSLLCEMGGV